MTPPPPVSIFHLEIFEGSDGQLYLNEIASRMGGAKIHTTLRHAFGQWLIEWYLRREFGTPVEPLATTPGTLAGGSLMRPRLGVVRTVPEKCDLPNIVQYTVAVQPGDCLEAATESTDAVATFVATGDTSADVDATLARAEEWFASEFAVEAADVAPTASQPIGR